MNLYTQNLFSLKLFQGHFGFVHKESVPDSLVFAFSKDLRTQSCQRTNVYSTKNIAVKLAEIVWDSLERV